MPSAVVPGQPSPALLVVAVAGRLDTALLDPIIGRGISNAAHWGYLATRSDQSKAVSFASLAKRQTK